MKRIISFFGVVLVLSMIFAIPVYASETSPFASNFFGSHSTYLSGVSTSSFQVCFNVTAVRTMAELGVDYIDVERSSDGVNWTVVKTYDKDDYSNLVATNTFNHSGTITYNNKQSGYQYRAYVEFYAKNSSGNKGYSGAYAYF